MFRNKKLFIITTLLGGISLAAIVLLFFFYIPINYKTIGVFFMVLSVIGKIIYTLIFISLERKILFKRIYYVCMSFAIIIFVLGLLLCIACKG